MGEEDEKKAGEKIEEKRYLTDEDIETKLRELRGKLPSFLIEDLKENLQGKLITEKQLGRIINRSIEAYRARKSAGDRSVFFSKKIEELDSKIEKLFEIMKKEKEEKKEEKEIKKSMEARKMEKEIPSISEIKPETLLFSSEKKPRLEDIPEDIFSTMIALKWLEFLVERVGTKNLSDVLEFYHDLNWISEKCVTKLLRYAKGTKAFHEDNDWKPVEKLSAQEHIMSLLFIERLGGNKISRDLLDNLERELKKIKATAEELYGV